MAAGKKLVILAAVNGGAQQDRDGAKVPITPAEIADAAHQCYKAGASVVHIHARGADKGPTSDIKVFSDIITRIRDKCDILIQNNERLRCSPRSANQRICVAERRRAAGAAYRRAEAGPVFLLPPGRGIFIILRAAIRAPCRT